MTGASHPASSSESDMGSVHFNLPTTAASVGIGARGGRGCREIGGPFKFITTWCCLIVRHTLRRRGTLRRITLKSLTFLSRCGRVLTSE